MNFFRTIDPRLPYILPVLAIVLSLPLPVYSRDWHKLLHIGGAVLFLGNILVTAAWMVLAENTKKPAIVHFAAKSVLQADLLFTIPGVLLIFINGLKLAPAYGGGDILGASWVVAALVLFVLSGMVWGVFLVRYQLQLIKLTEGDAPLGDEFERVYRLWMIWGGIATVLPLVSLLLMVFKPTLWR